MTEKTDAKETDPATEPAKQENTATETPTQGDGAAEGEKEGGEGTEPTEEEKRIAKEKEEERIAKEKEEEEKQKAKERAEYIKVRSQFDKLLHKHIIRLIEIDMEAGLQFDTATVAFLVLLVEKEKEIKDNPHTHTKRYTQESFFEDLNEIGVHVDDDLIEAFQGIVKLGYVGVNNKEKLSARIPALALVKFIDNLFSGMPGMNLVAYIAQCIDEVISGRKVLKENIKNFEQTLVSRGVALSKQNMKEEEKETIKKTATVYKVSEADLKAANELKKTNVQRLASLRTKGKKPLPEKPTYAQPTKVKELFKKGSDMPDPEEEARKKAEELAREQALEIEKKQEEIKKREDELKKAEEAALELEKQKEEMAAREEEIKKAEMAAKEAELAAKEAELKAAELAAREAEMAAKEAELAAKASEIEKAEEEKDVQEEPPQEPEMSVEDQIAQFEQDLAMPCPVCSIGKITSAVTGQNKEYYSCTNETCKFISWAKPYHFECPLCKNPFLIEFAGPDGLPNLKCPRATCTYSQAGVQNPVLIQQAAATGTPGVNPAGAPPKKKKRFIRRKKR